MSNRIVIHPVIITKPPAPLPRLCPPHAWARAYLTRGGTALVCRICGSTR